MAAKKKTSAKKKTTTAKKKATATKAAAPPKKKVAPTKKTATAKTAKSKAEAKPKKVSSKKAMATKKVEPKKVETKKAEPKKAEPKKAEAKKAEPKKAEAKKAETKKVDATRATSKTPAAAATPKMSPLRGKSVDDWAKNLTGWQSDALNLIRTLVTRHAPLATLEMKWGQPVWQHNGPFAYARPSTEHLTFGFWRGADLSDPADVLEGDGDRMRHVKITSIEDVSRLPLEEFIKEAVDLNEKQGNPTKRESLDRPRTAAARRPDRASSQPAQTRKLAHRHGQDR